MQLANTIAIIQGKSLNFGQSDYPKTPQDTQGIICIFSMLYERVDDVMVLIYSINAMWLYLFACIFGILEWSLLIRITYRFKQCNWHHLDAAADCHRL